MKPTILVIFGATGDLSSEKLIPSIFHIYKKGLLPKQFRMIGFARKDLGQEEFQDQVESIIDNSAKSGDSKDIKKFLRHVEYESGFFEELQDHKRLLKRLNAIEKKWGVCTNKLFYLAVPPKYYEDIARNLSKSKLTKPCSEKEGWTRVLIEKPFGKDEESAQSLDELLGKLFKEEQIFRIDHYLGKETVQNIVAFRFSNNFLDPAWGKKSIERIDVKFLEKEGVDARGKFYDGVGALRDVGGTHALQLLALFTMPEPAGFTPSEIRKARLRLLGSLRVKTPDEVAVSTMRGQYKGYRWTKGVGITSKTDTYFRVRADIDNEDWEGVPITLEGGKKMPEDLVEVSVFFKHRTPCLCPGYKHYQNILRYTIRPQEKITMSFWVKKPGGELKLREKNFEFDYQAAFPGQELSDAYHKLLYDAFLGDQSSFLSTEEIAASWRFIDPIIKGWKDNRAQLHAYKQNSNEMLLKDFTEQESSARSIGVIGLGKMGLPLAQNLHEHDWKVVGYTKGEADRGKLASTGVRTAQDLDELVSDLVRPRLIWLMVPHTEVDGILFDEFGLMELLDEGDTVIDGGNSYFKDSADRALKLAKAGINYLDAGVSGGPEGARRGAALMIGGKKEVFEANERLFADLSVKRGYGYMGKSGAGHFVKMVHNGIEYGYAQSLAEGFEVMKNAPFHLNLKAIADVYNNGSVIESRLMGWLKDAYDKYGVELAKVSGKVDESGEGRWTVKTARELGVPVKVIADALKFRAWTEKHNRTYTGKVVSALRGEFGGHEVEMKTRRK